MTNFWTLIHYRGLIKNLCYPFLDNMDDDECEQDMNTLAALLDTLIHRVQTTSKDNS
jgi:hypothetical protein